MLSATQSELNAITSTYHNVLAELKQESNNNSDLKCQMSELQQLYDDSLNTVKEYKQQLLDSVNTSQEQSTLQDIILRHTKDLEEKQTEILRLDATIQILREENKRQEEEIRNLHQDNCRLQEILKERNIKYEQRPAGGDNVVRVRKIGTTSKRPESFYPLSIPNANSSSSTAGRMTLKRRAEQLNQVLHIISARKDPSQADIVQTLAQFLRQYPDIALPACKTARISFQTDISPKDAVDLKVLLRLPMSRMRDLRRYLSRLKIRLLPSDRHLYKEMSGRQYMGEESVEVGIINLQKTGQSLADTPVAYFRVKCLKDYIASHIEKQLDMNNTWHDDNFNQELWLKIGGDKGGTTTKMAFQLVNQNAPNSSASTNIISMFEATDTYINLKEVFSNLSEQISELMKVKRIRVGGKMYPLRVFYFGDTEFLCKVFGHMGASSSYPCLWCHVQLKQLRHPNGKAHSPMKKGQDGKWIPDEDWPENRTLHSFQQDIANLLAEEEDGASARVSGRDHHSISKRPILPLPSDIKQIVPPSLHIILGLVVRYFKLLETECRKLDQDGVQCRDEQLANTWQKSSEDAKQAEVLLHEAREALQEENDILDGLQKACRGRVRNGMVLQPCSMPLCKLHVSKPKGVNPKDIPWIQCVNCGEGDSKGWFHDFCVGMTEEDASSEENDGFVCPVCTGDVAGPNDVIEIQEERVAKQKEQVEQTNEDYENKKQVLDSVYEKVVNSRGSLEKQLNDKLENELHVKRQAYHSQCFVGNHCKRILEGTDVLISVLPDTEEVKTLKSKMYGLFGRLRAIFRFFRSKFLTEQEVRALCMRCWELGLWFPKNFPEETIPPKLHFLICHIPECAQKWKTIGLLSEHGIESIHKDINAIERIYCTVRDSQERMRLVIGSHQQTTQTSNTAIQVTANAKKTCYIDGCKGRYKLTQDKKARKCQKCNHTIQVN
ncbi:uncharacterized protein [Amphiura filiformis]|uniref:uncharacterized protein n=1 Tax=Amphiura filiformis TaxID=82378 RepID=UPI003B2270DC